MKVKVTYEKHDINHDCLTGGTVSAIIKVVDKGDYPTTNIFDDGDVCIDIPSEKEELSSFASRAFPNGATASLWVKEILYKIQSQLAAWRSYYIPPDVEVEL